MFTLPSLPGRRQASIVAAFLMGAAVASGATIAFAHGGDTALIHACVKNSNGSIHIIAANDSCGSGETNLDWNIQGVAGPQGPAGTSGSVGAFVADLTNSKLFATGGSLAYRDFHQADLSGSQMDSTTLIGSDFHQANLSNTMLNDANFGTANFQSANLSGANLINARTELNQSPAGPTYWASVNFSGANFTGSRILFPDNGVVHQNPASPEIINFTSANFTNANLTNSLRFDDAALAGAIWSNTICPDGTNSNSNGNTCAGHLIP